MNRFEDVLIYFPKNIADILRKIKCADKIQELRLRRGKYINVKIFSKTFYVDNNGDIISQSDVNCLKILDDMFDEIFFNMCDMSIYAKDENINSGYITLKHGHRCAVAGSAVIHGGKIISIKDISSVNIRIAKEIIGCADILTEYIKNNGLNNMLILSPPCGGKTTLLRDLIRSIANGTLGKNYNISVADEKGELAAMHDGICQNDLGNTVDIFDSYSKETAIQNALRFFSPDLIVLDELCSIEEARGVIKGQNAGVPFIMTMHGDDLKSVMLRPQMKYLIEHRAVDTFVLLEGMSQPGKIKKIYKKDEIYA